MYFHVLHLFGFPARLERDRVALTWTSQGGDDTFATFPEKLRTVVGKALPAVKVVTAVYPKYETKGDLKECVARFRDW